MAEKLSPEELYSKLYRIAGHILRETNPCQIQKDAEGRVSCRDTRSPLRAGGSTQTLCCGGCRHLSDKGCNAEALSCKLWACWTLKREAPDVVSALQILNKAAQDARLPIIYIRLSKEEAFSHKPGFYAARG